MQQIASNLIQVVEDIKPLLQQISEIEASTKLEPNKWSKKEILGHLIDSASNNHQKFLRTIQQENVDFVGYQQNFWVDNQRYQLQSWQELISFWEHYNRHLAHIIKNVPTEALSNTITIDGVGPFRLDFIMTDYVEHLKHHLKQILPFTNLESKFENVYH